MRGIRAAQRGYQAPDLHHDNPSRGSRWSTLWLNDLESLPLVCYASGADVMGYPRHPGDPRPRAHFFWGHPGAEARRRRLWLVGSLGS